MMNGTRKRTPGKGLWALSVVGAVLMVGCDGENLFRPVVDDRPPDVSLELASDEVAVGEQLSVTVDVSGSTELDILEVWVRDPDGGARFPDSHELEGESDVVQHVFPIPMDGPPGQWTAHAQAWDEDGRDGEGEAPFTVVGDS